MILYWILLILTAFIAYTFGSLDTMVLASNFVFRRNLRRLGNSATWFSNFQRVYGIGGFAKLLVIELVKDIVPVLIGGLLLGKLLCKLTGGKINPLIGSAGVSAVPMAARVSQMEGQKANPSNFLLMHAMGPNVAGVIGSAVAAGFLLALFG